MNCLYEDAEGNEFTIHFDYTPSEQPSSDYCGCLAEVGIYSIIAECDGTDVIDNLNRMGEVELEEACWEAVDDHYGRLEAMRDDAADAKMEERKLYCNDLHAGAMTNDDYVSALEEMKNMIDDTLNRGEK